MYVTLQWNSEEMFCEFHRWSVSHMIREAGGGRCAWCSFLLLVCGGRLNQCQCVWQRCRFTRANTMKVNMRNNVTLLWNAHMMDNFKLPALRDSEAIRPIFFLQFYNILLNLSTPTLDTMLKYFIQFNL